MEHSESIKLTKERLSNIKTLSSKLNECRRKIEEVQSSAHDKEYINKLNLEIIKCERELRHIKNAMELLKEREQKIIALNLFEKVAVKDIASLINIRPKRVSQIKKKALETIADILYG